MRDFTIFDIAINFQHLGTWATFGDFNPKNKSKLPRQTAPTNNKFFFKIYQILETIQRWRHCLDKHKLGKSLWISRWTTPCSTCNHYTYALEIFDEKTRKLKKKEIKSKERKRRQTRWEIIYLNICAHFFSLYFRTAFPAAAYFTRDAMCIQPGI